MGTNWWEIFIIVAGIPLVLIPYAVYVDKNEDGFRIMFGFTGMVMAIVAVVLVMMGKI
jgi:hypothetical protein